uniref:Lysine-specific demethylase 6A-like n=1 Tax=Saccoglossus kowalevskii TaxID=10224 RepID=A0ABM0MD67_SACKO|nr:PREDICTED: lysine-specific demethylase 6A-like [Saccoglossus kowalevskii]
MANGQLQGDEKSSFSAQEKDLIAEYDSRLFGFLNLNGDDGTEKRALIEKGIAFYEEQVKEKKDCEDVEARVYCHLGHLHLLLEDYAKSLSGYQKFFSKQEDHWKD